MSFLDIVKDLFFGKTEERQDAEQYNESVEPVVKAKPTVAAKPKVAAKTSKKEKAIDPLIPEDSTLRRHYLANLEAEKQPKAIKAPVVAAAVAKQKEKAVETNPIEFSSIPQDATLKRHYISTLKYKIEENMPARPTDSKLRREYDAKVQTELNKLLA